MGIVDDCKSHLGMITLPPLLLQNKFQPLTMDQKQRKTLTKLENEIFQLNVCLLKEINLENICQKILSCELK